jgi:hypothetical protein
VVKNGKLMKEFCNKKIPIIIFLILIPLKSSAIYAFEKAGYYSVNIDGWIHNTIPEGDIFTCSKCNEQIQIQISYGPPLPKDNLYKNNKEFMKAFQDKKAQQKFADTIMQSSVPPGFKIIIDRTGLSKLGGLDVLQFHSKVDFISKISHDTNMMAIHKNRIVKITLNYFDGALNSKNNEFINNFFKSLKFQ